MDETWGDFQDSQEATLSEVFYGIINQYRFLREWDRDNALLDYASPNKSLCEIFDGFNPSGQAGMEFSVEEFLRNELLWSSDDSPSQRRAIYMDEYAFQLEDEGAIKMYFEGLKFIKGFASYLEHHKPSSPYLRSLVRGDNEEVKDVDINKARELLEVTPADRESTKKNPVDPVSLIFMDFLCFEENVFFNFYRAMQQECLAVEIKRNKESSKLLSILSQVEQKKKSFGQ